MNIIRTRVISAAGRLLVLVVALVTTGTWSQVRALHVASRFDSVLTSDVTSLPDACNEVPLETAAQLAGHDLSLEQPSLPPLAALQPTGQAQQVASTRTARVLTSGGAKPGRDRVALSSYHSSNHSKCRCLCAPVCFPQDRMYTVSPRDYYVNTLGRLLC